MEVGQGPNWGCSAKGKKKTYVISNSYMKSCYVCVVTAFDAEVWVEWSEKKQRNRIRVLESPGDRTLYRYSVLISRKNVLITSVLSRVGVNYRRVLDRMIGFNAPSTFTQLGTTGNKYSSIDILHTLQFTVTHTLGFSAFTSRILATDF
jgi:hypothetical protein